MMKNVLKKVVSLLSVLLLILLSTVTAFAHSGRTDSSGGHRDNNNVSGLGSYHYHCGGSSAHLHNYGYCPYTEVFPSSVKISAEKTTLGIGEEASIDASVYPGNACSTDVSWSSSDTSVVSVRGGVITAEGYGTAIITAETFNGKKSTIKVTVNEIKAESVSISLLSESSESSDSAESSENLLATSYYIGDSLDLVAKIAPENVDNPAIVWSSSNEKVATVSEEGHVEFLAKGKVEISATASNGVSDKLALKVKEKQVESVEIADDKISVILGEKHTIEAVVTPSDATYPELTWTVEDPEIVSVSDDGEFTALSCGETVITASAKNKVSDSITVQVKEIKAKSIEILGVDKMKPGDSISLSVAFTPADTTNQDIKWSVSDSEIASIDKNGVLTAIKGGTVNVIATTAYGVYAEVEVGITSPITVIISVIIAIGIGAAVIFIAIKKKKG